MCTLFIIEVKCSFFSVLDCCTLVLQFLDIWSLTRSLHFRIQEGGLSMTDKITHIQRDGKAFIIYDQQRWKNAGDMEDDAGSIFFSYLLNFVNS